jgi:hypothetical protein
MVNDAKKPGVGILRQRHMASDRFGLVHKPHHPTPSSERCRTQGVTVRQEVYRTAFIHEMLDEQGLLQLGLIALHRHRDRVGVQQSSLHHHQPSERRDPHVRVAEEVHFP